LLVKEHLINHRYCKQEIIIIIIVMTFYKFFLYVRHENEIISIHKKRIK